MQASGRVRWVAAGAAAAFLHVLILFLVPDAQHRVGFETLDAVQVELLAEREAPHAPSFQSASRSKEKAAPAAREEVNHPVSGVRQSATPPLRPQAKHSPPSGTMPDNPGLARPFPEDQTMHRNRVAEPVRSQSERAKPRKQLETGQHVAAAATTAQIMPRRIQAEIAARIVYPHLARRRGWQGEARFMLDVDRQTVRKLRMLASTGYPVLDRAAEQGIASVGRIPLSNGRYLLPVVFRLQ